MQHTWIWLTVLAALLQAVRTAAQKRLAERLSTLAATYVRSLLGLPIMVVYLVVVGLPPIEVLAASGIAFPLFALVAALTQAFGTAALLSLYRHRNFAAANQLARTNLVFTALIGSIFFSEAISPSGWVAIVLTLAGAVLLTRTDRAPGALSRLSAAIASIDAATLATGLFVGLMFGICNLMIREATLSLGHGSALQRAALTVVVVTALQVIVVGSWLAMREPGFAEGIRQNGRLALFVGATSAFGSIAWFAAFALTNASYVIAVGQIEAVFVVLIATFYFGERLRAAELAGIAIIIAGVLLFRAGSV